MKALIRTHCQTEKRFEQLKLSIQQLTSIDWLDIVIVDDQSLLADSIYQYCTDANIKYHLSDGTPNVINGFKQQLNLLDPHELALICCDDIILSSKYKEKLCYVVNDVIPNCTSWGIFGFFAPSFFPPERNTLRVLEHPTLFKLDLQYLLEHYSSYYGLIANIISPVLVDILKVDLQRNYNEVIHNYSFCEDRYVIDMCMRHNLDIYNTQIDYIQHNSHGRSFNDTVFDNGTLITPTDYSSKCFLP